MPGSLMDFYRFIVGKFKQRPVVVLEIVDERYVTDN